MEALIIASLIELLDLVCISDTISENNLVFPIKRDKTRRISEQEARFLLVMQLEEQKQSRYQYAVEAPTMQTYSFTGKGERSGNIDLCIYENGKRHSLVEFKALSHKQSSYSKDFEKLFFDYHSDTDNELCNFFVQILENENQKIEDRFKKAIEESMKKHKGERKMEVILFVCILTKNEIVKYNIKGSELKKITELKR